MESKSNLKSKKKGKAKKLKAKKARKTKPYRGQGRNK
jgi:hypothetical protein